MAATFWIEPNQAVALSGVPLETLLKRCTYRDDIGGGLGPRRMFEKQSVLDLMEDIATGRVRLRRRLRTTPTGTFTHIRFTEERRHQWLSRSS